MFAYLKHPKIEGSDLPDLANSHGKLIHIPASTAVYTCKTKISWDCCVKTVLVDENCTTMGITSMITQSEGGGG